MPTLRDTQQFIDDVLARRLAGRGNTVVSALLQHQMLVRSRLTEAAVAETLSADVQVVAPSRQVLADMQSIPDDNISRDLRYILLFDEMVANTMGRAMARIASRASVGSATSSGALLQTCNAILTDVRYVRYIAHALSLTVFRQVDISRQVHRDKHDPACACCRTGNLSLAAALSRGTLQAALQPVADQLTGDLGKVLRHAFRTGIHSWWHEDVDGGRWEHTLNGLRAHVLQGAASSYVTEWTISSLRPLLELPAAARHSPAAVKEYVTTMHRRLATLGLLDDRRGFLSGLDKTTLTSVHTLVMDCVVVPLRDVVKPMIYSAVVSGDVALLESVACLERLTVSRQASAEAELRVTLWLEEQLRSALAASLRELVSVAFGVEQSVIRHPEWSHSVIAQQRGKNTTDVATSLCRATTDLAEWIEQKTTLLRYVYAPRVGAESYEAIVRCKVLAVLGDGGRAQFQRAAQLIATMLHATLVSKRDADRALPVVEAALSWVSDKDVFLTEMTNCLEVRLLDSMPISAEVAERERTVIALLKGGTTHSCVRQMESMLQDAEKQKEIAESILLARSRSSTLDNIVSAAFDVQLGVLQNKLWNTVNCSPIIRTLPIDIHLMMRVVETAHRERWPSKVLSWGHASSRCVLLLNYTKQSNRPPVELTISLIGASILCMFDLLQSDCVQLSELEELVLLAKESDAAATDATAEGKRLLQVGLRRLIDMKILLEQRSDATDEATSLVLNRGFAPRERKLTAMPRTLLSALADAHASARTSATDDSQNKARFFALKAAIVRVMKSRKECSHGELFDATVRQLDKAFLPTSQRFKTVIADLIETDYIARKEGTVGTYTYLA